MSYQASATDDPSIASRTTGGSSGESSTASRIDSKDAFRIGGPGQLPLWPVETGPPSMTDPSLSSAAVEISISHLQLVEIPFNKVLFTSRYTRENNPTEADETLLIYASFEGNRDRLISVLDTLLQILYELGHRGRVEIVDPRAAGGIQTFPPVLSSKQREEWDSTLGYIIAVLRRIGVEWRQIMPSNRGYWAEVSVLTVVIKATDTIVCQPEIVHMWNELSEKGYSVEFVSTNGLWGGLFGDRHATINDERVRASLQWPFEPRFHGMGLSVGRVSTKTSGVSSTVGGYLRIRKGNEEEAVALGCYHGFRLEEDGDSDPNLDSMGSTDLCWPCQSPSPGDISLFSELLRNTASRSIPDNLPIPLKQKRHLEREDALTKLETIRSFDSYIGNIVAVSGWRNRELGSGHGAPLVFLDWACIAISPCHCPHPLNSIEDMQLQLLRYRPEGVEHWKTEKAIVDTFAPLPVGDTVVFKQGRTTGLTAGTLGGLVPAAHRIEGLPAGLHHRGFVVFSPPFRSTFSEAGDSGSWCLNGDGDLVGQIVAGDSRDGSAILIPISVIVEDIEGALKLPAGSVALP